MAHSVILDGIVLRFRNKKNGERVAIVKDSNSYVVFVIPNSGYIVGQEVHFVGQIMETERGSGYIRLVPIRI